MNRKSFIKTLGLTITGALVGIKLFARSTVGFYSYMVPGKCYMAFGRSCGKSTAMTHLVERTDSCYVCRVCGQAASDGDGFVGMPCPGPHEIDYRAAFAERLKIEVKNFHERHDTFGNPGVLPGVYLCLTAHDQAMIEELHGRGEMPLLFNPMIDESRLMGFRVKLNQPEFGLKMNQREFLA